MKAPAAGSRKSDEMRQRLAAGGRRHNHQRSLDGGQQQSGQWTRANNSQPLRVEGGRVAACGKISGR